MKNKRIDCTNEEGFLIFIFYILRLEVEAIYNEIPQR